jgi:hypothetical protein
MPYSTALQGAANLQPTYDNDQTLYATALQLLNTGITYLNNPSKGTQYPTSDDVIYGGNAIQWIQFANAIKARLFIHQCKHGNPAYEDSAIACVNNTNALTGSYTNAEVYFGSAATNNGPWFQFNNQRVGYIAFTGSTLIDSMQAMNDPRDSIYVNFGNGSLGNFYGLGTSPVEFITAEELDLIAAEANERLTNPAAVQAWIALYLNPEAWTTWRRLNAPVLSPIAGTEIIRRMIYPNSEVTLNPNCPPGVTIFQPQIFWDN